MCRSVHQQPISLDPLSQIQARRSNSCDNTASYIIDCNQVVEDVTPISSLERLNDALHSSQGQCIFSGCRSPSIDSCEMDGTHSVTQTNTSSSMNSTIIYEAAASVYYDRFRNHRDTGILSEQESEGCKLLFCVSLTAPSATFATLRQ